MRLALLAVLVALALAVGAEAAGDETEVAIPGRLFAPGELDALAGQTVTWRNADSGSHTVSSEDDVFDSGYLSPGSTFSHTFASTGTFPYFCRIHRSMRGVVRVFALILDGPPRQPRSASRRRGRMGSTPCRRGRGTPREPTAAG